MTVGKAGIKTAKFGMSSIAAIRKAMVTKDSREMLKYFTEEEVKLIDSTLKKFERNSPWFRRYMCGKESASDEEVNAYIQEIA